MTTETSEQEWYFDDPEKATALVKEANDPLWRKTRFHFYSRLKGAGIDCVGFIEELTAAAGLERWAFERTAEDYSRHVDRNTVVRMLRGDEEHPASKVLAARWNEFPVRDHEFSEGPMIGDLVLYRDGSDRTGFGVFHMGVMIHDVIFVHCAPRLNVCEGQIDDPTYSAKLFAHFRARAIPIDLE